MSDRTHITITGRPERADQVLALWDQIFPEPGKYEIAPLMAKAAGAELEGFEEWFLRALEDKAREHFVNAQLTMWEVLDELLERRHVSAPSALDFWELNRTLFDVSTASTARMVGIRIPLDVMQRLSVIGFTPREALDFPALAYRMGAIYERLQATQPLPWAELVTLAESKPLAPAEVLAIDHARARAGQFLRPVFDRSGEVWAVEKELFKIRGAVSAAVEDRRGPRDAGRELGNSQRAEGIIRDGQRVMRTEMADARNIGAWNAEASAWAPTALLFRQVSAGACKGCLRLYKNPDGTPRLYPKAELEAFDAMGVNTGGHKNWHPRIGSTHPNCACAPWQLYHPAMASLFNRSAPKYRELIERLGVFKEAA